MKNSPYIKYHDRLSNVIAAIQVMGTYKRYKLTFEEWADRISGDEKDGHKWESIFKDHPEFFRLDQNRQRASLVWRRNYPKTYDIDKREEISPEQFKALTPEGKERINRVPLKNEDISMLIDTAINLHTRALQIKQERRWWIPIGLTILGFIAGLLTKL